MYRMNPIPHRSQETRVIADGWLDRGSRDERELEAALRLAMAMRQRQQHASGRSTNSSYGHLNSQASTSAASASASAIASGMSSMHSGDDDWGPPPLLSASAPPGLGPDSALLVVGGDGRGSYESHTYMGGPPEASQSLHQYQYCQQQHHHQQQRQLQSQSQQKQRRQHQHQRQQLLQRREQHGSNRLSTETSIDSQGCSTESELELEVWGTRSSIKRNSNSNRN